MRCGEGIQHLKSETRLTHSYRRDKKGGPEAALFSSTSRANLYLGVDPLFEDEFLVLLELITVLQALVLILADHLAS